MTNPTLTSIDDARQKFRLISEGKRRAIKELEEHSLLAAEKKRDCRKITYTAFVKAREKGATVAEAELAAKAEASDYEFQADCENVLARVAKERLDLLEGERAGINRLADLSSKADPLVNA